MTEKPSYEELEKRIHQLEKTVSKHKQVDEALREREKQYKSLFENNHSAMLLIDPENGDIVDANSAAISYYGWSHEDITGKKIADINIFTKEKIFQEMERAKKEHRKHFFFCHLLSNKEIRDVEVYSGPIAVNGRKLLFSIVHDITERKRVEESLRKSEYNLTTHLQNTPVGAISWDLNFKTIEWNPAAESIFGYSKEEAMGKHVTELIIPEDMKELVDGVFQDLITEMGGIRSTNENITKDGERIICDWHNTTLKDVGGNVIGVASLVQNITERKKTFETLKEQKEFSEKILQTSNAIIVGLDKNHKIRIFNRGAEKITGFKSEEVIGKDWFKIFFKPGIYDEMDKVWESAWGAKFNSYINPVQTKNGDEKIISWQSTGMYDNADETKHILLSIGEDITERMQAQESLKKSEEKYRTIMESMKDTSYICSPELYIEYMNPAMMDRVGTDATGELCYKAIYDRDEKCSWCVFDQVKKGETVDYEMGDPKDNRYYSVSNSPILHADSDASKLTIFHDVTEIKETEAQLRQSRKMESIGTLAGGIAHDFNNLLYMISGNAELALEDIPKWNPVHTNLEEIKSASLRAAGIVKQLLNFSRKTDQKFKPIGAVTVIKDALKFLRSTIPTTIDIRKHLPEEDVTILADPIQINQVLMNLCINASQAMEDTGGIIEINVGNVNLPEETAGRYIDLPAGDYLKITVSDTGPGIAPEIIDRIFDPYFTTKEMGKGSGMGLSIVHGIIKNHNSAISVDSKPGKGTTFSLLIPVVDKKSKIEIETTSDLPSGTESILFVDDEEAITNMTGQMLKRLGYRVETRLNPEEALELFKSKPGSFDLVITDMTMPQMTGAKLSEKLMEIQSNIPVIICTGYSFLINEENAKQLGIAGYVMKPVSMSRIAKAIRKVLDK